MPQVGWPPRSIDHAYSADGVSLTFPTPGNTITLENIWTATTANLGGSALTVGQSNTVNVTVNGVSVGMAVVATPQVFPGANCTWFAYVSAANTVTVGVLAVAAITPTAGPYSVRVIN